MMPSRLRWVMATLVVLTVNVGGSEPTLSRERKEDAGLQLDSVLELEQTARLLAILLDSGRSVINENQPLFDEQGRADKGFTPEAFERQLIDVFRSRSGTDLRELDEAKVPSAAKKLLKELVVVSKQVVTEAQPQINKPQVGFKGFIPAVFGARVASRFTERTHVRLKQTALVPRNSLNAPDTSEKVALEAFADPAYPREKVISEVTSRSGALRLMFPLYTTRQCLDCHGEPKGELDRTGYPREGLKLGQNAGAISVMIPVHK
ncbi:MAG: Tll0287-like domain-containing protein [Nitrospiraceae bacterium]